VEIEPRARFPLALRAVRGSSPPHSRRSRSGFRFLAPFAARVGRRTTEKIL
jgi:hypothetical protein